MMPLIVMFGHSHFLGDLLDIVHDPAFPQRVSKIVTNMPEEIKQGRKTIAERLDRVGYGIAMQPLEEFSPGPAGSEEYVMGFSGGQQEDLVRLLRSRFELKFRMEN